MSHCPELEAQELKEEFARRLGEQQRTIDILKVRNQVPGIFAVMGISSSACIS